MMSIHDKIVPNLVGVDIGCGIYAVQLEETAPHEAGRLLSRMAAKETFT
jgi:RNA-splicing ligase RtcB